MKKIRSFVKSKPIKLDGFIGFRATVDGQILHPNGHSLSLHKQDKKSAFCRVCQNGVSKSVSVGKLMLLAFKPRQYTSTKIAVHKDGNPLNNGLDNLKWGTRRDQSDIAMKKDINFHRVQKMGKKYGSENAKKNNLGVIGAENLKNWLRKNKSYREVPESEIIAIRNLRKAGVSVSIIAKAFNRNRTWIYSIPLFGH